MASLNEILLIGRLGKDPAMRYTPAGKAVCQFSVATSRQFTGADGQKTENTTWHNIEVWGKLAEICNQYLGKGRLVFVQGRQVHESYEDAQTHAKKFFSKVVAGQVLFLDKGSEAAVAAADADAVGEESLEFDLAGA